jgi:hypothetical protein
LPLPPTIKIKTYTPIPKNDYSGEPFLRFCVLIVILGVFESLRLGVNETSR